MINEEKSNVLYKQTENRSRRLIKRKTKTPTHVHKQHDLHSQLSFNCIIFSR